MGMPFSSSPVFLVQSDTTVGLLCQDAKKLAHIKQRDVKKPFLMALSSFKELKEKTRVPKKFKKFVRRKKRATFVYPTKNRAIRVVQEEKHRDFLKRFGPVYSTSANKSGGKFDFEYLKKKVDIMVIDKSGFKENSPSRLFILNTKRTRRIR